MIGMKWQHFAVLHLSVSCAGGEWRWSFCAMGPNCFQLPAAAKISGRPLRHAGWHGSKLSRAVKQVLRSWVGWGDQHSLVKRAVLESLFSYSLLQLFEIFAYVQTYGLCILPFQEKTVLHRKMHKIDYLDFQFFYIPCRLQIWKAKNAPEKLKAH